MCVCVYIYIQTHRHTDTQTHRHTGTQAHRSCDRRDDFIFKICNYLNLKGNAATDPSNDVFMSQIVTLSEIIYKHSFTRYQGFGFDNGIFGLCMKFCFKFIYIYIYKHLFYFVFLYAHYCTVLILNT